MQLIYKAPASCYTIIPNSVLKAQNLSNGAKVLAFYLMSLPLNWQLNWQNIAKALNTSYASVQRYRNELVKEKFLNLSQEKNKEGKFKKIIYSFKLFKEEELQKDYDFKDHLESSTNVLNDAQEKEPLMQNTAYANLSKSIKTKIINNKKENLIKEKIQNAEIKIEATLPLYHSLMDSFNTFKDKLECKKEGKLFKDRLECFLQGEELAKAREWVEFRKEIFRINPQASIRKLRIAKEKGDDLVRNLQFCMDRDYRGYFAAPQNPQKSTKKRTDAQQKENEEIINALLKIDGFRFSNDLSQYLVNGRAVKENNGVYSYV